MRVLLGAHTIDPSRGGEAGIGWGWAQALAQHSGVDRVEVVAHPMARVAIEERLENDPTLSTRLRFHWVLPPRRIDPWKVDRPGGTQFHRVLPHYLLWQRAAAHRSRQLVNDVDIAHHVTPGTIFLHSFVAQLGVPYVIGPVGGGQVAPLVEAIRLLREFPDLLGAIEVARSLLIGRAGRRSVLRRRLADAAAVLCANSQTLELARRYQARSELMIDGGIAALPQERAALRVSSPTILWVGRMLPRRDPIAAVDVVESLQTWLPGARLLMIGDGELRSRVEQRIHQRDLSQIVTLLQSLTHASMVETYASASVFLFTSVRDTFGVQNLEAMAHGLPIVYRESSGVAVGDFAQEASVGVPNGSNWATESAQVIARLFARDGHEWRLRSNAALSLASRFTWSAKADRAVKLYERALGLTTTKQLQEYAPD